MQPLPDPSIFRRYAHVRRPPLSISLSPASTGLRAYVMVVPPETLVQDRYAPLKTRFPSLDRRALLLLIADEFWTPDMPSWAAIVPSPPLTQVCPPTPTNARPVSAQTYASMFDIPIPIHRKQADGAVDNDDDNNNDNDEDTTSPGIVLQMDYSSGSDKAWTAFCGALRNAEREFLVDQEGPASASASAPDNDGDGARARTSAAFPTFRTRRRECSASRRRGSRGRRRRGVGRRRRRARALFARL
jgi:hypothetical protein